MSAEEKEPISKGGIFISYSHADSAFVERLRERIKLEELSVWLDKHDLIPGNDLQSEINNAIKINEIVLPVLSKNSLASDWFWKELHIAREKEHLQGHDVLFPIAIDDSWQHPEKYSHIVREKIQDHLASFNYLKKKYILQFVPDAVNSIEFNKLIKAIKKKHNLGIDDDRSKLPDSYEVESLPIVTVNFGPEFDAEEIEACLSYVSELYRLQGGNGLKVVDKKMIAPEFAGVDND